MSAIGSISIPYLFHAIVLVQCSSALRADRYPHLYPGDTLIHVIDATRPPCDGAGDDVYALICPLAYGGIHLSEFIDNFNWNGFWLPPIPAWSAHGVYNSCSDGEGIFSYVVNEPGCPSDTVHLTI